MEFSPMVSLTFLVVWLVQISSSFSSYSAYDFPIAKPGCVDRCGDERIPYPFGMGEGCYYHDQYSNFSVECNSSQLNTLGSGFPITNISLGGQFHTSNYVGYDCYDQHNQSTKSNTPWNILGYPYTFNSTANKFIVIGCDSVAAVQGTTNLGDYATGCFSLCNRKADVTDGLCSGMGCCQTLIPNGAWQINVSLASLYNHSFVSSFNPCSFAFVIAEDAFQFSVDNLTNLVGVETLPVIVDWAIPNNNCDEAKTNKSSYACGMNTKCYVENGTLGYRCGCNQGYEGNPYLGCQDIDECRNPNQCGKYGACTNNVGSYECNCIKGYHKDSDVNGRCVANNKKKIWPIIVGVSLSGGAAFLLVFLFCFYSAWMRRKEMMSRQNFFKKNGGEILQQKLSSTQGGGIRIFTHVELQMATNDFNESQIIGRGGFGTVFKGQLVDKKVVAIKKSKGVDERQVDQFINEVLLLSKINSRYVVKLLGCCLETEVPLLVYEYIDNGTLFEHLHHKANASKLSWSIRLRIASEIAGVLSYLHSIASPPIIHRDIKSSNILLDHNYTAKVSDFGISRLISSDDDEVATMVQGTLGYLDPEYMQTGILTEKSDVYSFGIVLIELITGKKVLESNKSEAEKFLSNGFLASLKENHLVRMLDSSISCTDNIEQLNEVAMIAKRCISVRGEERPCMRDVERELVLLAARAKEISIEVFQIDSSKNKAMLGMQSTDYGICDDSSSTGQYSASYITTQQPLLDTTILSGR
ncbi:OLC1v1015654C1 [Oldenlandia corymbosa var. corymbosa]|uniref:OLC1v1015654C1 n=1 Tax=Oldenlandia corymbosa var. corymbosa TaxID=529605 RepID=A0AAV1E3T6_OLDCO|nr:OLC1v1015654C1 [Oldenlandia corymbosa var. corymbosa]